MSSLRGIMFCGKFILAAYFMATVSGCSYYSPNMAGNILAVDKFGQPENVKSGVIYSLSDTSDSDKYETHLKELVNSEGKPLLIYIHGGLNPATDSNERADKLVPEMSGYKPIFINWKSGFVTTYREHLLHDRQGTYWSVWGPVSSPFIALEDAGRGVIKAPMVWWYQFNDFARTIAFGAYPSEKSAMEVNQELLQDKREPFGSVPHVVEANGNLLDQRDGWDKTTDTVLGIGRLAFGLTTAPFFTSLGTGAWDTMKRRTNIIIDNSQTVLSNPAVTEFDPRYGAVYHLFEEISRRQKIDSGLKIVLIGHSMGTIIASKVLALWPEINYDRIIFMAAACTIDDFRAALPHHLTKDKETHFYNYMLHPVAENLEAHIYGIGGTGSLLDQIDNIYENATSESHRTLGKWVNVMNGIRFFDIKEVKSHIHLVTMPLKKEWPTSHGAFDDLYFGEKKHKWRFWLPEDEPKESDFR